MAELGGKQLSSLLESLPGIASVLRSPVADAIANTIRAAAGLGEFHENDVRELLQYATRRGLMGNDEAEFLVEEVKGIWKKAAKRGRPKPAKRPAPAPEVRVPVQDLKAAEAVKKTPPKKAAKAKTARQVPARSSTKKTTKSPAAKKKAVKKASAKSKAAKKTTAKKPKKTTAKKARRK